jgi:hypothetical protein
MFSDGSDCNRESELTVGTQQGMWGKCGENNPGPRVVEIAGFSEARLVKNNKLMT